MIERKIVIGLITSTEYIQQVRSIWDSELLEAPMARRIAEWCIEYYDKYQKAPNTDIQGIYFRKLKEGLPQDIAEEIEQDILPELSEEYEEEQFNLNYILDQTRDYLKERRLLQFSEEIRANIEDGELTEAERVAMNYSSPGDNAEKSLDLSHSEETAARIEKAFDTTLHSVVQYPRALGQFWNNQMVRGGFVALMASEKRGKTFWLMDISVRASKQGARVAFFQAGDMTEDQQLKRLCIHLSKRSDREDYCGKMFQAVRDCVFNQLNDCDRPERECDVGVFEDRTMKEIRQQIKMDDLKIAFKDNPDYLPCYNCREYQTHKWGTPWLKSVEIKNPLTSVQAVRYANKFFKRPFKLSSYANGTLSVKEIKSVLNIWERESGFVPDLITVDYADLLTPDNPHLEFRHQQNEIWKALRNLSQEKHALVLTATQADADSYGRDRLTLKNFSEDKRKYAHVTAMYGLNQDKNGREKAIGIMRINEIVIREGDFSNTHEVRVLQNLRRGLPFLGSYW